tara:strand:- start:686 stop:1147 length:462 start_codon:yes stop_codon:yes gene_type:complete
MDVNSSIDSLSHIFQSESQKLEKIIESISQTSEKKIPEIINLYYHVTMVQTLAKKIKSDLISTKPEHQKLFEEISKTGKYMSEKFSKSLHPQILSHLTNSIKNSTENLKLLGQNSEQKTKETIEKEAVLYKKLRELMSTKEFVEQYDHGIKDD